ncbi:MAG: 3-isopropylmalate/(R)-2-methylmalate dehydratase small subunit [Gaiellaceae bacterium]|jgi:3-isopropylmalate/(R)-2-methylmalate dehydratase small subunit|nr:3-isopropylmalate/(R)-2-methylmalate dehydratase small subunit [Gaiellaceae bacterium]
MKPFRRVSAPVAVLDRADVDTDQIIPKQFLKRIERTGFGEFLFFDWRLDEAGQPRPEFELNQPDAAGAKILIGGANFGCGSSREHAAWALQDYGFEVVIAPSFGDIFATNCLKTGVVTIALPADQLRTLIDSVGGGAFAEVDLERQLIIDPSGREIPFDFDPFQRECLLNGLDDIARSLLHEDRVKAYEASHPARVDTASLAAG